jgi:hypothetical protein
MGCLVMAGILANSGWSAAAVTAPSTATLECRIRATPDTNFLRLEALARSGAAASGRYRLSVTKESASGTSRNVQSGTFALAPHQERVLTTVILDRSAEGHYSAKLSLEADLGRASCSSP